MVMQKMAKSSDRQPLFPVQADTQTLLPLINRRLVDAGLRKPVQAISAQLEPSAESAEHDTKANTMNASASSGAEAGAGAATALESTEGRATDSVKRMRHVERIASADAVASIRGSVSPQAGLAAAQTPERPATTSVAHFRASTHAKLPQVAKARGLQPQAAATYSAFLKGFYRHKPKLWRMMRRKMQAGLSQVWPLLLL